MAGPLQSTSTVMNKILTAYNIDPDFISTLVTVDERPKVSESFGNTIIIRSASANEHGSWKLDIVEPHKLTECRNLVSASIYGGKLTR